MIRFSKYIWLYALISALVLVPGVYSLARYGLRPSIDFTGGAVLEFRLKSAPAASDIKETAASLDIGVTDVSFRTGAYTVRMKATDEEKLAAFTTSLSDKYGSMDIIKKEIVGPVLGRELLVKAVIASFLAICAILLYVAYAFANVRFGVSAVIAMIHDALVMFGSFSLLGVFLGVEVDTLFVTAVLTTLSFSVHDTIVIFDRIREYRKRDTRGSFSDISDIALTETMGRSLVNSFTIIFMLTALVLFGGQTIRWFAVALLIGTITGTYSSPFVATPILLLWDKFTKRKMK